MLLFVLLVLKNYVVRDVGVLINVGFILFSRTLPKTLEELWLCGVLSIDLKYSSGNSKRKKSRSAEVKPSSSSSSFRLLIDCMMNFGCCHPPCLCEP